jgi:hypothetical protein
MEFYSYKYAIPYLIFLGYLFVLMSEEFYKFNKQQSTKRVRMLTMLGFLFFFGLRGFVNTDWFGYYPFFEELPTIWQIHNITFSSEIGFTIYSALIKSIWNSYFFWIFISTLIDVLILNAVFKKYAKYYVLSFIVFFLFSGVMIEVNLLRNVKSILLFLLSLRFLQERKALPYFLLNGLGMLFHLSAIIYLPLFFILHRQYSKVLLWAIFIAGNIIYLCSFKYIQPVFAFFADAIGGNVQVKIHSYFQHELYNHATGLTIGYLERFTTYILTMIFYNKIASRPGYTVFINMYVLYFICFFYFSELSELSMRLATLFVSSYWFLYPALFSLVRKLENKRMILLCLVVYASWKTIRGYDNVFQKYSNITFGIEKYEEKRKFYDAHLYHFMYQERKAR